VQIAAADPDMSSGMGRRIIEATPFGPFGVIWSTFDGSPRIVRVLLATAGRRQTGRGRRREWPTDTWR
jgi:hypothetical protein